MVNPWNSPCTFLPFLSLWASDSGRGGSQRAWAGSWHRRCRQLFLIAFASSTGVACLQGCCSLATLFLRQPLSFMGPVAVGSGLHAGRSFLGSCRLVASAEAGSLPHKLAPQSGDGSSGPGSSETQRLGLPRVAG